MTTLSRYVFLLYKQEGKVDMESELRTDPLNLKDRAFSTLDFYSTYQVGVLREKRRYIFYFQSARITSRLRDLPSASLIMR